MGAKQTENGKAFEYACVLALHEFLCSDTFIEITESKQLDTAEKHYLALPLETQNNLILAAKAAARIIIRLEPQLQFASDTNLLTLELQSDSKGQGGDVRDILCIKKTAAWEIGLSCKHNHSAVKHSRLSATIDFGKDWFGLPCSENYFAEVKPIFEELRKIRDTSKSAGSPALWSDIFDKSQRYYLPVLNAFIAELQRLNAIDANVPQLLVRYLIGRNDFYKVIANVQGKFTRVEGININGTLNKSVNGVKALIQVPRLKLPTKFWSIGFKDNSDNTLIVACDNGWEISLRIHNASSKVEPSLKFDVQLTSTPASLHSQLEPWNLQ